MKKLDCLNNVISCSLHKVIAIPNFFRDNPFPNEPQIKTTERVSRVAEETSFLYTKYHDVHHLISRLFQELNDRFKPINIRGMRNLIGYPAFWLKKYDNDNDPKLEYLILLCLGNSFKQSGTASDNLSATPSAEQKSQTDLVISVTVPSTDLQPKLPETALEKVTCSMQHVYELLINTKNYFSKKRLVGSSRRLDDSTIKYNERYQAAFSNLVKHSYPDKSGIKPRDEKLWAWVRAGVEIMFPIPSEHQEDYADLYQLLYACQTNLVILNAIADDIADNFRDKQFLDQILSVFPQELSSNYFIQQNMDGEETIDLNSKENVEHYLRQVVFKDTSAIEEKIRLKHVDKYSQLYQHNKENRKWIFSEILKRKADAESDAYTLEKQSQEKIDRCISDSYISDQVRLAVEKEVNSKVQYILLAWEIFTDSFIEFERLIIEAFKRLETSEAQDLSSIRGIIIDAYKQIFHNFKTSAQLNCKTTLGNIIIASNTASHNMNIMAFHQMCAVLSLSLESVSASDIFNFIDDEKVKQLFMTEQYLGRYSNILATGVPTQKTNSDGTAEIKLSREFKLGDITGTPELMKYLNDPIRSKTTRDAIASIIVNLNKKSQDTGIRTEAIKAFSTLLIEIDAQKVITDKFVDKFKEYQQLLDDYPDKTSPDFKVVFQSFKDDSKPNPQIVFLLFYLMFKGEI